MACISKKNLRIITRLIEAGFISSKQVLKLSLLDLQKIPGLNNSDISSIVELQKAIADKQVYEFLAKAEDESGT